MSDIKEQDILKLLRGEASPKKLKKLEAWASEDVDNATDLELYQTIYDESEHLASYTRVDADSEWTAFSKALHNSVTDSELLHYFDGLASPAERKKVEEWRSFSKSNAQEFDAFNVLITESAKVNEYKTVDIESEWKAFDQMIKGQANPPNLTAVGAAPVAAAILDTKQPEVQKTYTPTATPTATTTTPPPTSTSTTTTGAKEVQFQPVVEEEKSNTRFMWRSLAAAASLLLLGAVAIQFFTEGGLFGSSSDTQYATFATAEEPDYIIMSDGSRADLDRTSSITYFKDVNTTEIRDVEIDGEGVFDVESLPEKPFIVTAPKTGIGVRVIGTKFRIEGGRDEFVEIIENIEGTVKAYALDDTMNYVVMTEGDRYGFDGYQFVNLNVEEYDGQDYTILHVLDYLHNVSDWRVVSGSEIEFDSDGIVNIDLSKPYEEILQDLSERAGFEYVDRECDGCYEVRRFVID